MMSSRVKECLKQRSKNFSDEKAARTTPKVVTRMLGIATTRQKPSARLDERQIEM